MRILKRLAVGFGIYRVVQFRLRENDPPTITRKRRHRYEAADKASDIPAANPFTLNP